MKRPSLHLLALFLPAIALGGCSSRKILRLENEVLKHQNSELRAQLEGCQRQVPPQDFAADVTLEVVQDYLRRSGLPEGELTAPGVLLVPIQGRNTTFQMTIQLFAQERVLYMAANDYLEIEEAASSKAMVLLLTQVATLNYELLLGKFQLNPNTGAISLSVELNLDDGLGYRTFYAVIHHLIKTADEKYPDLLRTAQSSGI